MKRSDLHREWARVLDMHEGTGIDPNTCWKFDGVQMNREPSFNSAPERYEFLLGIVEGRSVFRGDDLYWKHDGIKFNWSQGEFYNYKDYDHLTWTKPERKFAINGVELPCPIHDGNWAFAFGNLRVYKFKTQDNRDKVEQALIKILDEASK